MRNLMEIPVETSFAYAPSFRAMTQTVLKR
jgi:hypothetical protein